MAYSKKCRFQAGPLLKSIAEGPELGKAFWLKTSDNIRIRLAHWMGSKRHGTVFLLPGRTEYIEKYGRTAKIICDLGYDVIVLDWRGQGLSDRLDGDPLLGQIKEFSEYQRDLDAAIDFSQRYHLPEPWFILAHSMGGGIGLRAAHRNLGFKAAAFTGPMWGIVGPVLINPFKHIIAKLGIVLGQADNYALTTSRESYTAVSEFLGNTLTKDQEMWSYMKRQVIEHPNLQLAGPSYRWVNAALREINELHALPPPECPGLCLVGDGESIVEKNRIKTLMSSWSNGRLIEVPDALHEILMLNNHRQNVILNDICGFFARS